MRRSKTKRIKILRWWIDKLARVNSGSQIEGIRADGGRAENLLKTCLNGGKLNKLIETGVAITERSYTHWSKSFCWHRHWHSEP